MENSAATLLPTPPKSCLGGDLGGFLGGGDLGGVILFRLWDTHFVQSGELHTNLKLMDFYIKNCYNISVRIFFFHFRNFLLKHWNLEKNSGFFFFLQK